MKGRGQWLLGRRGGGRCRGDPGRKVEEAKPEPEPFSPLRPRRGGAGVGARATQSWTPRLRGEEGAGSPRKDPYTHTHYLPEKLPQGSTALSRRKPLQNRLAAPPRPPEGPGGAEPSPTQGFEAPSRTSVGPLRPAGQRGGGGFLLHQAPTPLLPFAGLFPGTRGLAPSPRLASRPFPPRPAPHSGPCLSLETYPIPSFGSLENLKSSRDQLPSVGTDPSPASGSSPFPPPSDLLPPRIAPLAARPAQAPSSPWPSAVLLPQCPLGSGGGEGSFLPAPAPPLALASLTVSESDPGPFPPKR
ncbi:uncharacterized protein LOC114028981 [Vombatus ursinus]|uniref:uncharacterized protein LOC114028981 n=1 Tax=Vombatus ursinus TaxID=29139 RepID=UPI000FFD2CDD|nr:uncharacterized protein LOC114028981 [Vombatus ursinus]